MVCTALAPAIQPDRDYSQEDCLRAVTGDVGFKEVLMLPLSGICSKTWADSRTESPHLGSLPVALTPMGLITPGCSKNAFTWADQ